MDVQTGLLCILLFIISGGILLFITVYGMQEKTYEEAIAEQRKMPKDVLGLGRQSKDKGKNKKQKRQGKKAKEKTSNNKPVPKKKNTSKSLNANNAKVNVKDNEQSHVNFLTPEAKVLNKVDNSVKSEKTKKKEQIKPILVTKNQTVAKTKFGQKGVTVNHFSEIIPKDDLQLKLINKKNSQPMNSSLKNQVNFKENLTNEKINSKDNIAKDSLKKKQNNQTENQNNIKNEKEIKKSDKKNKNSKNNAENNEDTLKNKKVKNEKTQDSVNTIEKVKNNETKNDSPKSVKTSKNNKLKNEDQRLQQTQQQQKLQNFEQKHIKIDTNKGFDVNAEKVPVQAVKVNNNNQQQSFSKKPKKNELIFLQQMTGKDNININLLIPLINKAELSRSEVQILTDILLTKHLDEVTDQFEWTEGRQDPVVKLKKQLAEKEKALAEEQEASQACQNKLKELRLEYNSERARFSQACRQYDETIVAKQGEIQNLHAANRHLIDNHVAEKQALTQKIQQLQAQINDENLMIRKLQDDHNQAQNALQQELVSQGQQMEIHIARLREQLQETQKNFEAQIHSKIQEAEQIRASFNAELQKNRRYEEELRDLREQQVQNQNIIKNLETRASQLKETSSHTQELVRQIEELQRVNKELDMRCNTSHQLEEELKFEKTKLQNELHSFKNKMMELQNEYEKLSKDREKLTTQVATKVDLEKDFMRLKEENLDLKSQVTAFTKIEKEAQQLREENENLAAQVTAFTERPAAEGRENGDTPCNEVKKKNINSEFIDHENELQKNSALEQIEDELKQKKLLIEKLNTQVDGFQSDINRLSSEIIKHKTEITKLKEELEVQRTKNNDLRKKNWKAMEALDATEKSLENNLKKAKKSAQAELEEIQLEVKNLFKKIFPSIKINEKKISKDWINELEKECLIHMEKLEESKKDTNKFDSAYVEELENKNSQLQTLVVHYKTIIEDTELMLNKLQKHVEQEEIRWRQQYETLEPQIQVLNEKLSVAENKNEKLQSKIKELENNDKSLEFQKEINRLRKLLDGQSEKFKTMEKDMEALNLKLSEEELRYKELNKEMTNLKDEIKSEQKALAEENKKRIILEEELKFMKNEKLKEKTFNNPSDFVNMEKNSLEGQ